MIESRQVQTDNRPATPAAPSLWTLPALPDLCGPRELAGIIENFRAWEETATSASPEVNELNRAGRAQIGGAALERLLTLAFHASFQKDERRYTRGRLFVVSRQQPQPRKIVAFHPPITLAEPNTLRLLGPTLASDNYALSVVPHGAYNYCDGICLMDESKGAAPVPDVSLRRTGGYAGLAVAILDPGELVVEEGVLRLRLRANRIEEGSVPPSAPLVSEWLAEWTSELCTACTARDREAFTPLNLAPFLEVAAVWSQILGTALDLKHGGCFVVLANPVTAPIQIKFLTQTGSLGDQIVRYWLACANAIRIKDQGGFADALQECNRLKHIVRASIRALGTLAATDGCVVLDRGLNLHGFGGVITLPQGIAASARTLVDYQTKEPLAEEQLLRRTGTRHRSAFQLCKLHDHTLAFVVSQDGTLRVFASDSRHVYVSGSLGML
jgi:hypothetical protein